MKQPVKAQEIWLADISSWKHRQRKTDLINVCDGLPPTETTYEIQSQLVTGDNTKTHVNTRCEQCKSDSEPTQMQDVNQTWHVLRYCVENIFPNVQAAKLNNKEQTEHWRNVWCVLEITPGTKRANAGWDTQNILKWLFI